MKNIIDEQYQDLLFDVLVNGEKRKDRTGVGTLSVFARQIEVDISKQFPLLTTKKVYWKGVVHELIWFLRGDTNVKYLHENNTHIWDEWADAEGEVGRIYGAQWRSWDNFKNASKDEYEVKTIDQISNLIEGLQTNPTSRRHVVSAWNVAELDEMALPPCHYSMEFYVRKGKYLDCRWIQRSVDSFLGLPYNISSYALLTYMLANLVGLKPGRLTGSLGDCHIYLNHVKQVKEQLMRKPTKYKSPILTLDKVNSIDDYTWENIHLDKYKSYPAISAPIAV